MNEPLLDQRLHPSEAWLAVRYLCISLWWFVLLSREEKQPRSPTVGEPQRLPTLVYISCSPSPTIPPGTYHHLHGPRVNGVWVSGFPPCLYVHITTHTGTLHYAHPGSISGWAVMIPPSRPHGPPPFSPPPNRTGTHTHLGMDR